MIGGWDHQHLLTTDSWENAGVLIIIPDTSTLEGEVIYHPIISNQYREKTRGHHLSERFQRLLSPICQMKKSGDVGLLKGGVGKNSLSSGSQLYRLRMIYGFIYIYVNIYTYIWCMCIYIW